MKISIKEVKELQAQSLGKAAFVSVIIPALNAQRFIGNCLASVSNLDYPKDCLEIIVIDNGSRDKTLDIVKGYKARILQFPGLTVAALRNRAAQCAKGEILAFLDADCIAPKSWLTRAVARLKQEAQAAGAEYALPKDTSWAERVWDMHVEPRRRDEGAQWIPSGNLIVFKESFEKIGGFNENLITSEDVDFCRRFRKKGFTIISDERLSVVHLGNPKTVKNFFIKEIWRGKGAFQNFLKALPKIRLTRAVGFSLFMLLSMCAAMFGLFAVIILGKWQILAFSILAPFFVSLSLAIKTLWGKDKWNYIFALTMLYLVYGAARALSIFDYRVWANRGKASIPVLLYHDIWPADFDISAAEPGKRPYILRKSDFQRQMQWLRDNGYRVTGIDGVVDELAHGSWLMAHGEKSVVLVFDDGWRSNYEIAYPLLKKYGFSATFFVTTDFIGKKDMMSWEQIKEMADNGMEIGSHGLTHRIPLELSDKELEYELNQSRRILEENLGREIKHFSSPTGFRDFRIIRMAKKSGYKSVCFSKAVLSSTDDSRDFHILSKIGIKRDMDLGTFKQVAQGKGLESIRLKQILRNITKSFLGPRRYDWMRSFVLRRAG
jgi:peptidoglycan/xylan/chitin deacetylase (PgdA/CDA1 family)/glycosyltransferase involved in cell wall biosynthesis